jgi:hypothetical protein
MIGFPMLASLAAMAAAQPPQAPAATPGPPPTETQPDIVVRGQQEQALRDFVAALSEAGRSGQLARWNQEICPTVIGIDPPQAGFMTRRIAETAASLELRARASNCRPTMLIVVTADAAGLAGDFAHHYPITLASDGRWKLARFVATRNAVRWLSVTELCAAGCVLPNSRLTRATHPEFKAMIVIVDAGRIGGFSLGELSDYVAMVALGDPPLESRKPDGSILSMFTRARPEGGRFMLTTGDLSYLAGLYRSSSEVSAQSQRSSIARHMRRDRRDEP